MTCQEYLQQLRGSFQPVKVLSRKENSQVLQMRSVSLGKEMVVRTYSQPVAAYAALCQLRHRNLPEIYDVVFLEDGQLVLEEYIPGITVGQVLESGLYSYGGAIKILQGVCAAAITIHSLGIVHRDIKPENVIVSDSGVVKLVDLHASRRTDPQKTGDTQVLGTIGYAAYEQLGISQCDCRADIFSMGVLLNVMLTGEHPSKVLARGHAGKVIHKCTQIDPGSRYQSVNKLLQDL